MSESVETTKEFTLFENRTLAEGWCTAMSNSLKQYSIKPEFVISEYTGDIEDHMEIITK